MSVLTRLMEETGPLAESIARLVTPSGPEGPGRDGLAAEVLQETRIAEEEIREGRFQRIMALVAGFSAIVSGYEAYSQHRRGAFNNWLMWTPAWLTAPMVASVVGAFFSKKVAQTLLPIASIISLIDGIVGFAYHIRGIGRMGGGFRVGQYNIVMGPPVFAPLLVTIVGILGLLASLLRHSKGGDRPCAQRPFLQALQQAPASDPRGTVRPRSPSGAQPSRRTSPYCPLDRRELCQARHRGIPVRRHASPSGSLGVGT